MTPKPNGDLRRHTDKLIAEIHSTVGDIKTDVAVNKTLLTSHENWLKDHEIKLDNHSTEITKSKTIFRGVTAFIGMAFAALLTWIGLGDK